MSSFTCPQGHTSDTGDFCSDCGIEMNPAAAAANPPAVSVSSPVPAAKGTGEHCPTCSTERDDHSSVFCGVCGYNYSTGQGGDLSEAQPSTPAAVTVTTAPPTGSGARVDIEISYTDPARAGDAPLKFSLFDEENLLGRKEANFKQSVSIEDAAVSKRHAMIIRTATNWAIRDLNSTNGTKVNGTEVKPGTEQPLSVGDVVTVGEFTKITITAIS